jgi:hypothetical protein
MKVMLIQVVNERPNVLPASTKPTIHLLHDTLQHAVGNRAVFTPDLGCKKDEIRELQTLVLRTKNEKG